MRPFTLAATVGSIFLAAFLSALQGPSAAAERVGGPVFKELPGSTGWPEEAGGGKGVLEYSSGDFVVEGIVFHSDIGKRSAYIRKQGSDRGKVLHVGDRVGPFRLSVIEDSSVTLYHANRILILELDRLELE